MNLFAIGTRCIDTDAMPLSNESMTYLAPALQVIMALGLFNVWLLRFSRATPYRGGRAKNLKQEFAVYGLPGWFFLLVGALKLSSAVGLLVGIWFPEVALGSASLLIALMLGALAMHIKVRDPIKKSAPAFLMLAMATLVVAFSPLL